MVKKEALTFVIFGGTGDLAKNKLAIAFAHLVHNKVLDKKSTLIGVSNKEFTDKQYRQFLINGVNEKKEKHHIKDINVKYVKIDFDNSDEIKRLSEILPYCEIGKCNRIYYFATGFRFFPKIIKSLAKYNLISRNDGNKVLFEKPFGDNLNSSIALDKELHKFVTEEQIFRIDHYMGKKSVSDIMDFKKYNNNFWRNVNSKTLDKIEIKLEEKIGVENRINYYDKTGTIRDVIQSHLLEVLALILMEKSNKLDRKNISIEMTKILKEISPVNYKDNLLGQYSSYKKECKKYGIKKTNTETFAKISLECNNERWKNVKIILIAGKKLSRKNGEIIFYFKDNSKLIMNLQPKEFIKLVNSKLKLNNLSKITDFNANTPDAYELLINKAIDNKRNLFVSSDEIHESWRIIDKIESSKNKIKLIVYKDNTNPY